MQALRKLEVSVVVPLNLPCLAIFPGLESLCLYTQPLGADCLSTLPSLKHLTRLRLSVAPEAVQQQPQAAARAGADGQSSVLSFPAVPSLHHLDLHLCEACSLTAPWGDMPALRHLKLTSLHDTASVDLSTAGTGLSRLEALNVGMEGWARVDFALLPALKSAQLFCRKVKSAASVRQAASLTHIYFGTDRADGELSHPWMAELLRSAPPTLRQLHLRGKWTWELAQALVGVQRLHTLTIDSSGDNEELPEGPVWQHLQVLCWRACSRLPLVSGGCTALPWVSVFALQGPWP